MNYNKIAKLSKKIETIKQLDKEIINIEKIAMLISNGNKCGFKISVEKNPEEEEKKPILDSDGSLIINITEVAATQTHWLFGGGSTDTPKKDKNKKSFKSPLNDKFGLQILGIVLSEKNSIRNRIIKEIENAHT